MESWFQDVRFALRTLRRRPLFAGVSAITLGLGIGATTAMFSVVDGVLLQSTPFRQPTELVHVWRIAEWAQGSPGLVGRTWDRLPLRGEQFAEVQAQSRTFDGVASHNAVDGTITGGGAVQRVKVGVASASLLRVLGVRTVLGRWFLPEEESFAQNIITEPVVVVSGEFWREQLGSDPGVIGTTLELEGRSYAIIGVLPSGFRLRYLGMHWLGEDRRGARDVWVPWGSGFLMGNGGNKETIARLAPGATIEQARHEVQGILESGDPEVEVRVVPRMDDATLGLGSPLLLLLAATAVLLVIACLNTATLYLGELQGRMQELSTRAALGAGRLRVARQLLTESLVLGLVGGLLGVALAFGGTRALVAVAPPLPRVEHVGVDMRVLAVAGLLAVLAGLLFGTMPALVSASRAANPLLRISRRVSQRRQGLDGAMVTAQVALTVVVLVVGGLLGRSLGKLMTVDPGFDPSRLAMVHLTLPWDLTYDDVEHYYDAIADRLLSVPGVVQVTAASRLPFPGLTNTSTVRITREDGSVTGASAQQVSVLERYHETMGIPIIAGRGFTRADRRGSERVLIVTENFARRYWPDRSPIGERVRYNGEPTIIGITGDVKRNRLGVEADPVVYTPLRQAYWKDVKFVVRSDGSSREIPLAEIRETVRLIDTDVPVIQIATMDDLIVDSATDERYRTMLIGVFGFLAAFLAAAGIFGVTARGVSQRTREFGIRMALGAQVRGLMRLVLGGSVVTGLVGTALGLLGAFWVSRSLAGFLFGVEPFDPLVFFAVGLGAVLLSLLASYVPACRIVSVDPASALRAE